MSKQQDIISVRNYNEKTFCVIGPRTKRYKEQFKQMGGKWNPYLRDENGDRFKAWIFHKNKANEVKNFLDIAEKKAELGVDTQTEYSDTASEYEEQEYSQDIPKHVKTKSDHYDSEYEEFNSAYEEEFVTMKKQIRQLQLQVKKLKKKIEPQPKLEKTSFLKKLGTGIYITTIAFLTVTVAAVFIPVFPSFQKIIYSS